MVFKGTVTQNIIILKYGQTLLNYKAASEPNNKTCYTYLELNKIICYTYLVQTAYQKKNIYLIMFNSLGIQGLFFKKHHH